MLAFLIHYQRRKGQLLFVDSGTVSSLGVRIFGRPKVQGLLDLAQADVSGFQACQKKHTKSVRVCQNDESSI